MFENHRHSEGHPSRRGTDLSPTVPIFPRHFHPQVYTEDLYACPEAGGPPVSGRAAGFLLAASLLFWLAFLALVAWSVHQPVEETAAPDAPEAGQSHLLYPGAVLISSLANHGATSPADCDPHNCGDPHPRAFESDLAHRSLKKVIQHPTLQSQCGRAFLNRSVRGGNGWYYPCRWSGLERA